VTLASGCRHLDLEHVQLVESHRSPP
jgi:hypothetical protein